VKIWKMDVENEVKIVQEVIRGKTLKQVRDEGIYSQVQEQGQERTWLEKFTPLEKKNKDVYDEVFVGHLPVSFQILLHFFRKYFSKKLFKAKKIKKFQFFSKKHQNFSKKNKFYSKNLRISKKQFKIKKNNCFKKKVKIFQKKIKNFRKKIWLFFNFFVERF